MKTIALKAGLNLPISGAPKQELAPSPMISQVAIIGDDYIGMKPTMEVKPGDRVKAGQLLFTDKKNKGVIFTAPGAGEITAINRGAKRKFESLVIRLDGDDAVTFLSESNDHKSFNGKKIRDILINSGMWTSIRTRPFGKNPAINSTPSSIFITAADTTPLAPSPEVIISRYRDEFTTGVEVLTKLTDTPVHFCTTTDQPIPCPDLPTLQKWKFSGPHPAGLASTHIHFIDPVAENHMVWHISYQDVIGIGYLFNTGRLLTERIIALSGPKVTAPTLYQIPMGACIDELCKDKLDEGPIRVLSGSVLDGREALGTKNFLGRFHNQVSALEESSGRSLFNWIMPGGDRFSTTPVFSSALRKLAKFALPTATWGGSRAIFPLRSYENVMPLDIIATQLLKSIMVEDCERAKELGALELIEEDLALCSFVCPGKNSFGPKLRQVLTTIEEEG